MEPMTKKNSKYVSKVGLFIALFSVPLCPPGFSSAPESQQREQALRERVEQLYNLLQQGNWTKAESYLTEESKEIFRNQSKEPIVGFEIESIGLDGSGEKATVVVRQQVFTQFAPKPFPMPQTTSWRFVKGVWYVELPKLGPDWMKLAFSSISSSKNVSPPKTPASKELKFGSEWCGLGRVQYGQIKVARFPFTNVTNHVVTLADVMTGCECLRVKTQQKEYKSGESGVLEIEFDPSSLRIDVAQPFTQTVLVKSSPGGALTQLTISAGLLPRPGEPQKPLDRR